MRAIIPCAGFGTRMSMNPNQAKEMLTDPWSYKASEPLIQYALDLCAKHDLEPLIVTREEKKDLIEYCKSHEAEVMIIEPKGEWPNTVLACQSRWGIDNILILPDTRFSSPNVIGYMKRDLSLGASVSVALHKVKDRTQWCVVEGYSIVEKSANPGPGWAMGLIAFEHSVGVPLFSRLAERGEYFSLEQASFQYLEQFIDITRTGRIEYVP